MLNATEILTAFLNIVDCSKLWPEVEQYGNLNRAWVETTLQRITAGQLRLEVIPESQQLLATRPDSSRTITTTELSALCFGAAISSYDLVGGKEIVPAPTAWQRNLDRHGVQYYMSKVTTNRVSEVRLDLTPEEWCAVGMQDGEFYRGGAGAMLQDIMNTAFRYGGWISLRALQRFAELSQELDGASSPCTDTSLLPRWFSRIEKLSPWERLGALWQLLAEQVKGSVP